MAADVLIRRCTLCIARRGGWSWGADPRGLVRAALRRLPQLIGEQVAAAAWPEDADHTVDAPLRLRLSVHVHELQAFAAAPDGAVPSPAESVLVQRLGQAVQDLVRQLTGPVAPSPQRPEPPVAPLDGAPLPQPASWAGNVLAVLSDWLRDGLLADTLLTFGPEVLQAWHEELVRARASSGADANADSVPDALLDALAAEVTALPLPLRAGRVSAWVRRIVLMTEASVRLGLAPGDGRITARLHSHAGYTVPDIAPDASTAADAPAALTRGDWRQPALSPTHPRDVVVAPPGPRRSQAFEMAVPFALPFLLLGPLARAGYLRTLAAVFDTARITPDLTPAFGVALARKVLAPPQRGWFRDTAAVASAHALAGTDPAPADGALDELARRLAPHQAPLDAEIANGLELGHTRGMPLVLQSASVRGDAGWCLCDAEGMFQIAWTDRIERLFPRLAAFGGELVVVPEAAATPGLLRRLDDAGFTFVTDAPPGRDEAWRTLRGTPLKVWTNDAADTPGPPLAAAPSIERWAQDSAALWQALAVARPAWPAGAEAALERHLALAAALALGTIAWTLWGRREATHPLLALDRFGDIDAHAVFRSDHVRVQLPLGRRFLDLKRTGLLEDVADVPWFGGRTLRFVQG